MRSIKRIFSVLCTIISLSTTLYAQGSGWQVNPFDFQYDMSSYVYLQIDGQRVTDYSNYELAAFVGDECRGVAEVQSAGDATWLYMRIRSNTSSGDVVTFKMYDKTKALDFGIIETITFEAQKSIGQPSTPQELTRKNVYSITAASDDESLGTVSIEGGGKYVGQDSEVTATATPVKEGYEFEEWTSKGVVVSTENPYRFNATENVSLVAYFKLKKFDVTFVIDDDESTTKSLEFGSVIDKPADPVKEGHSFKGWEPEFKDGAKVPLDGITYSAKWEVNRYTVTFNTDGGSTIDPLRFAYGTEVLIPTAPTRKGHTFAGWDKEVPATMPANHLEFKALWTINKYDVVFKSDDEEITKSTLDYGTTITAPKNPVKEGHTFTGWDPVFTEGATVPEDGITYTAQWSVNQYTITFNSDGGTEVASITQNYGTAIVAPSAPTKKGHTFAGWDKEVPATMPAANTALTANWTVNQYDVVFKSDDKEISKSTLDYGTAIPAPKNPVKEGHTFTGWDPVFTEGATVPEGGITYTAQWSVNQYTITFNSDGGTEVAPITQNYGTAVVAPSAPTKKGHTFAGWDKEVPATMPAANTALTANWTVNQYDVVFKSDDKEITKETLAYGTAITAPKNPTKEGHSFTGWSPAFAEGATVPEGGITYTAQWSANAYTITFNSNGGSAVASIIQDYGTKVTAPAAPTKEGHTFAGWDKEVPATMPAADVTLTANWTVNQYDVVFKSDDKEISKSTLDYGTAITAPKNPTKEGHTFTGWSPAIAEGATVPEGGITYTAQWSANKYTITFNSNGGSAVASIIQDYGTKVTAPAAPTKKGHTFAGWDKEVPATMPAADMTLTANWTVNKYDVVFKSDGKEISKSTLAYGTAITAPENPKKDLHVFAGWSPDFKAGATVPEGGITYTALFNIDTEQVKTRFNTLMSGISIAEIDEDADEVIMQDVSYDYDKIKVAYSEAAAALKLTEPEKLYAGYQKAQDALKAYAEFCEENGQPQAFEFTLTDGWSTIILPFDYEKPEGWEFYNVMSLNGNGNTINLEAVESVKSNTPYLINGVQGKKIIFVGHVPASVKNASNGLLTGVLESAYTAKKGDYVLKNVGGDIVFQLVESEASVGVSNCYLTLPETTSKPSVLYVKRTTTAIESITADGEDGQQIFNISGQRQQRAIRGINIINGKKVWVN